MILLFCIFCSSLFVTDDSKPTKQVSELLKLDGLYDEKDDLEEVVKKTQKNWIAVRWGNNNIERIDLKDSQELEKQRIQVEEIIWKMGLFNAQKPTRTTYDYAIVPGAFLDGVRLRLSELIKLWEQGTRFHSLYFFSGDRPLRKDGPDKPGWKLPENSAYETEYDMMKVVWEQTLIPEEMREALTGKVFFVRAPRGEHARPSTKEHYETWLAEFHPKPGSILVMNHPLYWAHHKLVAESVLGPDFSLDIASPEMSQAELERKKGSIVSIIHDSIAKCLYECSVEKRARASCRDAVENQKLG